MTKTRQLLRRRRRPLPLCAAPRPRRGALAQCAHDATPSRQWMLWSSSKTQYIRVMRVFSECHIVWNHYVRITHASHLCALAARRSHSQSPECEYSSFWRAQRARRAVQSRPTCDVVPVPPTRWPPGRQSRRPCRARSEGKRRDSKQSGLSEMIFVFITAGAQRAPLQHRAPSPRADRAS